MKLLRILPFLFLAFPSVAMAADLCCRCAAPGNPETTCVNVINPPRGGRSQTEICNQAPKDYTLEGWTCELVLGAECQPTNSGGVCERGPMPVMDAKNPPGESAAAVGSIQKPPQPGIIPKLNVPIPGLTFTQESSNQGSLLSQYLVAAYRFGISVTALAATIMFVWGAFQYLLGSAIPQIKNGQTIMKEAIIGMILVFGATMILRTVNPATTRLSSLTLEPIEAIAAQNEDVTDASVLIDAGAPATPSTARGSFLSWNADELTGAEYINAPPGSTSQPLDVPVFKQASGPWANKAFGPAGAPACEGKNNDSFSVAGCCTTYYNAGCGAASLAMLLTFNGVETDPGKTGEVLVSAGLRTCNKGTYFGRGSAERIRSLTGNKTLTSFGAGMAGIKSAITALRGGQPVMFLCSNCTGKTASGGSKNYKGHYMVLTGIDTTGRIFTVSDVGRSDQNAIVNISQPELKKHGGGFWALQ